jgi:hypothetical protein
MPKIAYSAKRLGDKTLDIIDRANTIIDEYLAQGFDLTLRQLYYQFIARDEFPTSWIDTEYNQRNGLGADTKNTEKNYKRLGDIIADGRMVGLIDWEAITDRTRNLRANSHWSGPADIIESAAQSFRLDRWDGQERRCEVWIEKDALIGILEQVCPDNDVPYFSCRGYTSISEVWAAAQRIGKILQQGTDVTVFHLGDHDPSGVDMSRDIADRMDTFIEHDSEEWDGDEFGTFELRRIALTMAQVRQYNPPPNPAKASDARYRKYRNLYGDECWELDALDPTTLVALIQSAIDEVRNASQWNVVQDREEQGRKQLKIASRRWPDVTAFLKGASDGKK